MQVERLQSTVRDRRAGYTQSLNVLRHAKQARVGIQHSYRFRCTVSSASHYKHGSSMRNGFRIRTAQELLMADNAKRAKEPKRSTEIQTRIKNQKIKRYIRTGSNILMDQRDVKWQSDWCDLSARLGQTWWQSPPSCLDLEKQTKKFSRLDFVMCWSSDSISVKPSLTCIHILISRN